MATVVLQYAGAGLGGLLGGPMGAMLGRAAGALAGSFIDSKLMGSRRGVSGPRLDDLHVLASSEGASIPVLWGRARLAGQVIWASPLEEKITTEETGGGKGASAGPEVTEYAYFANFAVGLCEGEISLIGRVWADGKDLDLSAVTHRLYLGTEDQLPDSLIIAHEGDDAPAYRGLAYVVFERLPLSRFGNRIPQLSFEVVRSAGELERRIKAVALIPGSTEFGYDTRIVTKSLGGGATEAENAHAAAHASDWTRSLDGLEALCPNLGAVSLTVSWFGSDLRCADCQISPRTENSFKRTKPEAWSVAGLERAEVFEVSRTPDGHAAFGGTPSDSSILRAIADLKSRGLEVLLYPFLQMDIPLANSLPDPWSEENAQSPYPWRGRITCSPAPGRAGSPDKTLAALDQVKTFFGRSAAQDFRIENGKVRYFGPEEWSYRRFILHYAMLCRLAGGVDRFLIGSEMRGLTALRSSAVEFPAVAELVALAAEVKSILPAASISYAADWSEYFGHQPTDGSGDVFFHLDPLWASPAVDFIGIDNYVPLADWREGALHLDLLAGHSSGDAPDYLKANIEGAEGYDWHYASALDRDAQIRTPIGDNAYGKPWVFRFKDLRHWWSNLHYDRPGGVENGEPTAWRPEAKPICFTELGCPAVDKGANAPNCFYDPKSAESALPPASTGTRDDLMQRSVLNTVLAYWSEEEGRNPISSVYGGPMIDLARAFLWAWDARPFPHFPGLAEIWADAANHERGHWLNGRLGSVPLAGLVQGICRRFGFADADTEALEGIVDGYVLDGIMSARDAIEPLSRAFAFDAVESQGRLRFLSRRAAHFLPVHPDDLVEQGADKPLFTLSRMQETELPASVKLTYVEGARDYRQAAVESQRSVGSSRRTSLITLPAVLSQSLAQGLADAMLFDAWNARETAELRLPPSLLRFEPGDGLALVQANAALPFRIEEISEWNGLSVRAHGLDSTLFTARAGAARDSGAAAPQALGQPLALYLDLPFLTASASEHGLWLAACADPWPGSLAVYRRQGLSLSFSRTLKTPGVIGETLDPLPQGPLWRRDRRTKLRIRLYRGALQSISEAELLMGGNVAAIGDAASGFEIVQFSEAHLVGERTYEISSLLRGQLGSSPEMVHERAVGASFVLLDKSLVQLPMTSADLGLELAWAIGPAARNPGDDSYREDIIVNRGRALRPLPPCQVRAKRLANGDLALSWIRQTRSDGDSWELAEVPLGEEREAYLLEILATGEVRRTLTTGQISYLYARADRLADFGAEPSSLTLRISQLSVACGAGASTEVTLDV